MHHIDAQYCLARCCHFLDGGVVTMQQYEAVVSRLPGSPRQTLGNPIAIQEVMIPCQHMALHKAVGQQIGFYPGEPRDRTPEFTIKSSGHLNLYDTKTRGYQRIATEEDVKKWNNAIEARVKKAGELEKNWSRNDHESDTNEPRKCC